MFCAYCGAKLEDGSIYCSDCGSKLVEIIASKEQQSEAEEWKETSDIVEEHPYTHVEEPNDIPKDQYILGEEPIVIPEDMFTTVEQPDDVGEDLYRLEDQPDETQESRYEQIEQAVKKFGNQEVEPVIEMIVCMICGAPLERGSVFCPNCGSRMAPVTKTVGGKKKKKGLLAAAIIFAVLVLGAGGFLIYSKITLGKLGDSIETFKSLTAEKGLDDYEEYSTLIKDAEEKASGWLLFGALDMEKKLDEASLECQELSQALIDLMAKRSDYVNLSVSLIMESNQENIIYEYLNEFDAAVTAADKEKAEAILADLESEKNTLITDNKVYLDSLLSELYRYENPDFTDADWELFHNEVTMAENYIIANEFVKAKDQILNCSASIATTEERIAVEKEAAAIALLYAKPEILTVMISDVIYDNYNYRTEFEQALEAEIGIDIVFQQFGADSYYDAVNTAFASGTLPEVVYLTQDMYKEFQNQGVLTDITDYWYESELLTSPNYYGEETMERLKIDGKLYGFTPVRGYTNVTYIRQSWLDEFGLSVPTTYDEFYQMLATFSEHKMGGSSQATYGMTAPGFLSNTEPYVSFLQPFYQKAVAEIYQASNGVWIDGFVQPEMMDALYRLQDTYSKGYLDPNMADRTVADAISEFGSGRCGVISLWEGDGADYLINELKKNGFEDDIVVMEPLEEMSCYVGKEAAVFALTTSCVNPGGVMKYFFEPMLDGGAVQKLWTYGVEGYHWAKAGTTILEEDIVLSNLDNQLVTLPYENKDPVAYNYNLIDPLRVLATFEGTDPGISLISDLAAISASIANQYYEASPNVKYNQTYWYNFGEIQAAREEAVNKVMLEGVDPVNAIEEYNAKVQNIMDQVLSEMNQ